MKNKSWVCFILALVSVVLLAGCAGEDSGGGGVVESVDKGQEEGLIGNDEENQEYNEEVFEDNKSKKETSDEMLESSEASDCV
ncbi:MAG: hypothetical protein LBC82_08560, partial [Oscillospiraceae bacterium]|nr:hypothetical protein [Oscillospiraceae bacterium]